MLSVTAFLLLLLVSAISGGSTEVAVTPVHQQIKQPGTATVNCQFPARPLVECRVRVSDHGPSRLFDLLLDFGLGPESPQMVLRSRLYGKHLANASYHGFGLREGHCGLRMEAAWTGYSLAVLVECLGQTQDGGLARGLGLVTVDVLPELPSISATPLILVVAPHSDVAVAFKTRERQTLDKCAIRTPKAGTVYVTPTKSLPAGTRYRHNTSLARGECGYALVNVTQADSGVWRGWADKGNTAAMQATVVLVEEVPVGGPELTVTDPSTLHVGGRLQATCRAPPGVPPAELSWWLGGRQLRARVSQNMTRPGDLKSAWPWQPSPIVQTLTHTLAEADVGQVLECRMAHVAMAGTSSDRRDLAVANGSDACGRRSRRRLAGTTALSAGGRAAGKAEFPWHVGVYRLSTDRKGVVSYQQQCGGTLVSQHFFISAAHCFWDPGNKKHQNATSYRAALGKHTLAWEAEDARVQLREIAAVHRPVRFGISRNFEADIALVRLSAPAILSEDVNVVCVDWGRRFVFHQPPLDADSVGTVPGWGLTENKTRTKTLRFVDLPYVPFEECHASVPDTFKPFLLIDKICGGFVNRSTGVCVGDSGGGYVFPVGRKGAEQYFLRAVVSNGPGDRGTNSRPCRPEYVSVFTLVSMYSAWMQGIMVAAEGDQP